MKKNSLFLAAVVLCLGACSNDPGDPVEEGCRSSDDCAEDLLPHCSVESGECVACTDDGHCDEGETCSTAFECVERDPSNGGGNGGETGCTSNADCQAPSTPYCDAASESCVECLEDVHCSAILGEECVDFTCQGDRGCDIEGFVPAVQTTSYNASYDVLEYIAATAESGDRDQILIQWYGSFGSPFTGVGMYPIAKNSNYLDCGLCVTLSRINAAGDEVAYFFAIDGAIEITVLDHEADVLQGVLRDVVFAEWNDGNDTPVPGGSTWCIDGMEIDASVPSRLPVPACTGDGDCRDPLKCNIATGKCVECLVSAHCSEPKAHCHPEALACVECLENSNCDEGAGEACILGGCRIPSCDYDDLVVVDEAIEFDDWWPSLDYKGRTAERADGSFDMLWIEWYFDDEDFTELSVGSHEVGTGRNSNYGDCYLCVRIVQGCVEGVGCEKVFYATEGTLDISEYGGHLSSFVATLDDAVFVEVTIESDFTSVPVPGGELWCLADHTLTGTMQGDPPGS